LAGLIVSLPKAAVLFREDRYVSHSERGFSYALVWNYDAARRHTLSEVGYRVLQAADGEQSVGLLMFILGFSKEQQAQFLAELPGLWSDRLLVLHPDFKR
jgi:carbamoyltransferase